jgi:hypothetical protein
MPGTIFPVGEFIAARLAPTLRLPRQYRAALHRREANPTAFGSFLMIATNLCIFAKW